jgi:hypothetical protein
MTEQPHRLGLAIPLRCIASQLCGALNVQGALARQGEGWDAFEVSLCRLSWLALCPHNTGLAHP